MNYKHEHEYRTVEEVETIPLLDFKKNPKFVKFIIIFAITLGIIWLISKLPQKEPELLPARKIKRDSAIARVYRRNQKKENCEQYALLAIHSGWYPVLYRGVAIANDSIWLNAGEVWKYGKTCIGELKRYPGQIYYYDGKYLLDREDLRYIKQFIGNEAECLIEEKMKI